MRYLVVDSRRHDLDEMLALKSPIIVGVEGDIRVHSSFSDVSRRHFGIRYEGSAEPKSIVAYDMTRRSVTKINGEVLSDDRSGRILVNGDRINLGGKFYCFYGESE